MESFDSSPNYMRARIRFDANKENSPGGSEYDEIMSVSSSTGGSAVNGPYTRKLSNNGIKNRAGNKKTMKNFGSIRSFRRRAKPRVTQSPVPISDDEEESLAGSSQASPHYLKATTSSQGKKTLSQASPLHSDGSDKTSSQPKMALSRTSSLRNVRILIKRTSFKPKRSLLRHSEDVGVERATYSSTLRDSKFPVPVELHPGGEEPEKSPAMKVCRYHHCSLHGHCHGGDDPAPPLKHFLRRRRQPLKKQKSVIPKTESVPRGKQSSDRKKKLHKRQVDPEVEVEPLNQERFNDSIAVSDAENKNGSDSYEGNYPNEETQVFGDGCNDFENSYLVELAFGETSFPERSYQDNLNILRKYSTPDQDFGESSAGRKGYCSTCSCHKEEVATYPRRAEADLTSHELSSSSLDGNNIGIPQNEPTVDSDTNSLASFQQPKEEVDMYIDDISVSCGDEVATSPRRPKADLTSHELSSSSLDGNNIGIPQNEPTVDSDTNSLASFQKPKEEVDMYIDDISVSGGDEVAGEDGQGTPVASDETVKGSEFSSASCDIQTSTDSNSEEEGDSIAESLSAGDSKVNEVARVEDSETNTPRDGGVLHFSKPRHMSMWNLIHLHMSSNLPVESTDKLVQGDDGENPVNGSSSVLAKNSSDLSRESSDIGIGTGTNDSEIQEIELRKLFAVKLVREAIERILLPEVQDQASDDQSVASDSTPRAEFMEINRSKDAFTKENDAESDADRVNCNVPSDLKDDSVVTGDASGGEIRETEKQVVRKSEKKAPKHWSNLKKWILLQRFIRELEKVRKFNPRKPRHLPLNPDPEAEKVNLRPQTLDGRKSAEEWMLDHALRQAVSQLAPTQKKKVALLVRAFETVVPPQENSQVQFRVPRLRNSCLASDDRVLSISDSANEEISVKMVKETEKAHEVKGDGESPLTSNEMTALSSTLSTSTDDLIASNENIKVEDPGLENGEPSSKSRSWSSLDVDGMSVPAEATPGPSFLTEAPKAGNTVADLTETEVVPTVQGLQDVISDSTEGEAKYGSQSNQMDRKNHMKMWHMIYQHVVSGIAEKVGQELLEGGDDDEAEDNMLPATSNGDLSSDLLQTSDSNNVRSGLTKSDALKLIKEAVDEILLPEVQDDASDTQSVTSESAPEQDIPERDLKAEALISKKSELSRSKNWSKLKKLILLKRSIKALTKAREIKPQPQTPDVEPEKVDLRQQMMDERKKAEQWMLDYAVQHIVTKLTPARKRRVSMLVEAFEAVVPFPEI